MPLYEYDCPGCGQPFEKRVRMDEADGVPCPQCGNKHTQRRLSRIMIKGKSTASSGSGSAPLPVSGSL